MNSVLDVVRDLRFALTALRRTPGFTLIAVLTLGLGVGANTTAFSAFNEILLRPLPYADTHHLERIYRATPQNPRGGVSAADYLTLRSELTAYGAVAAYASTQMSVSEPGEPAEFATGARISDNLFPLLQVQPELGRGFRPDEMIFGNHRVLLISHRYWQERFGGDANVIGRTLRVDGEVHDIVGVLPDTINDWRHLGRVDFFRPLGLSEQESADRTTAWVRLIGRRSSTLTRAQGEEIIASFGRRLADEHPVAHAGTTWRTLAVTDAMVTAEVPAFLSMFVGLSAFVLLIACSNLANLLLARTIARAREFAVRSALGASRRRLLRPLVLESLLLAIAGAVCALLFADWAAGWISANSADPNGNRITVALDWNVFRWAFGACLLTAIAFGAAPALFLLRLDPNSSLRSGARGNTGDRWQRRFRHALIIGQFAFAMVLLTGAALFTRGFDELNNRDYGWDPAPLVTATVLVPRATYADSAAIAELHRLAVERLEQLPGVASASISYTMPVFGLSGLRKYVVDGHEAPPPGSEPAAVVNGVSAHYFETVGTRLLGGRTFTASDTHMSPRVFVINDAMARGLFGAESALGRRIARTGGDTLAWGEIVGVVADIEAVSADPSPVTYQLYQPMAQEPRHFAEIAVRSAGVVPAALVESIRNALIAIDADIAVRNLEPGAASVARVNRQLGMVGTMFSFLGLLGLGLAVLGMYGVIARTTALRTSEFGIRLALGGVASDITRIVLTSGAKLAVTGSAFGLVGVFGITRLMAFIFPTMHTRSIPVVTAVTTVLIIVALAACYLPARHAARRSPADTLRTQ